MFCKKCGKTVIGSFCSGCGIHYPDNKLQNGEIILNDYEVISFLKEGSYGRVYKGKNIRINEYVVIKELKLVQYSDPKQTAEDIEQFKNEAKFLKRVTHKNIVRIIDYGHCKGKFIIVLEYIDGGDLVDLKNRKRVSHKETSKIILDILSGLETLHSAGIINRDLKPNNVLYSSKYDSWIIIDLGISKSINFGTTRGAKGGYSEFFSSPEQIRNIPTDERSDIYSIGAIMFYLLYPGSFRANKMSTVLRTVHGPSPTEQEIKKLCPKISNRLSAVVAKAMSVDPNNRYASVSELKNEIIRLNQSAKYGFITSHIPINQGKQRISGIIQKMKNRVSRFKMPGIYNHKIIHILKRINYKILIPAASSVALVWLLSQLVLFPYLFDNSNKSETGIFSLRKDADERSSVKEKALKGMISGYKVNFREGPTIKSSVLYKLNTPAIVSVLERLNNGWYKVAVNGDTGYIWGPNVRPITISDIWYQAGELEVSIWLYDKFGNLITRAKKGSKVVVGEKKSNSVYIYLPDGNKGFVPKSSVVFLQYN